MNDADIHELLAPAVQRPLPPVAFSLDDVVRQGISVRRRHRAGAVGAVLAVVVVLAAGFAVLRPGVQGQPAAVPTVAELRAARVVHYALSIVPLPADAHLVSPVSGMKQLDPAPAGPSVHRTVWYATPQQPPDVGKWLNAHAWGVGWGSSSSYSATDGEATLVWAGGQVQNVDSPGPIVILTIRRRDGGSIVRVDGWQRPQPVTTRDSATLIGSATSVAVTRGAQGTAAYSSTLTLDVTGARVVALARALDSLPPAWAVSDRTCTPQQSTAFTFHVAAGTLVFTDQPVCGQVLVTLNGKNFPALTAFDLGLKDAVTGLTG